MDGVLDALNPWGGLLSIIGMALTIPLAVIGNLITPKCQELWAMTSAHRKQSRIAKLNQLIKQLERFDQPELEHLFSTAGKLLALSLTFLMGVSVFGSIYAAARSQMSGAAVLLLSAPAPATATARKILTGLRTADFVGFASMMISVVLADMTLAELYRKCAMISPY